MIIWYALGGVVYLSVGHLLYQLTFGSLDEQPPLLTRLIVVGAWPVFMLFCLVLYMAFAPRN